MVLLRSLILWIVGNSADATTVVVVVGEKTVTYSCGCEPQF